MKPILLKLSTVVLFFALIGAGCKDENCEEEFQVVDIIEFGDPNAQYWLQNIVKEEEVVNLVIDSHEDYEKYVASNDELPSIDFNNNTLLSGMIKTSSSDTVIEQSVTKKCDTYTYKIVVGNGNLGVVSKVYYFAIVEKVTGNVIFNVKYK